RASRSAIGAEENVLVRGSKSWAVPIGAPEESCPPTTSKRPLARRVAVWSWRPRTRTFFFTSRGGQAGVIRETWALSMKSLRDTVLLSWTRRSEVLKRVERASQLPGKMLG